MTSLRLLLRWSFRDLKERKIQVIAISLIIGLGTGSYVGLSSTIHWRQFAFDQSNEQLKMFDLKMALTQGGWVNKTELKALIETLPHSEWIIAREFRVILPISVNASNINRSILVNGRIIGIDTSNGTENLTVNGIKIIEGRDLDGSDTNASVCILEYNFADYYGLKPNTQAILLPGGNNISFVGTGMSPEYFMVVEENSFLAESAFCALFMPILTAQMLARQFIPGLPNDRVNEAIFLLSPEISEEDMSTLKMEISTAFETKFSTVDINFIEKEDQPSYRIQKEDIKNDAELYFVISFIVLLAAAFGTFNLVSRVVTSHRRQIGINMALGVPPLNLAYRYLIFSFEIALGGVVLGFLLSVLIGGWIGDVLSELVSFPIWEQWLVTELFIQGAILGILIPFSATIIPIIRAVRMPPIHAIHTGYSLSTGKGAAPLLERADVPGSIFVQLPFRNFARNPRRTFSTIIGVALALCVLVAILALLDGANNLLDREQEIMETNSPNRINVVFSNFLNASNPPIENLTQNTKLEKVVSTVQIPGTLFNSRDSFPLTLYFFDLENEIWVPELVEGNQTRKPSVPGIILSRKTAGDLGVSIGDRIILEHLYRESAFQYSTINSTVEVIGIYGSQVRFWAFMDISNTNMLNTTGLINAMMLVPKSGISIESVQADLFEISGYSGAQTISRLVETYEELIELFTSILTVIQYAVMALALLIAFNTATINFDERIREFATMGAFGTPIRTSTWMLLIESVIIGIFGTALGYYPLGFIVMEIFQSQIRISMPEINLTGILYPDSISIILFIGVVVVAISPLFSIRKLIKIDLPSALRVIE
ncbi:MAG: FtsX-like permease family protein [Candidatus Thorarchaeota archaeon]